MHIHPSLIEILLVEDNPADVELTRRTLGNSQVKTTMHVVGDGEAALNFLYKRAGYENAARPDVIFLDINLPKKNGKEVLETIKQDDLLKTIPVVMLTSSDAEHNIAESYQLRANCYIIKPVTLDAFLEVIKSIEEFWLGMIRLPSFNPAN